MENRPKRDIVPPEQHIGTIKNAEFEFLKQVEKRIGTIFLTQNFFVKITTIIVIICYNVRYISNL